MEEVYFLTLRQKMVRMWSSPEPKGTFSRGPCCMVHPTGQLLGMLSGPRVPASCVLKLTACLD